MFQMVMLSLGAVAYELTLFAVVLFVIIGFGDLLIDLIWIVRTLWRRVAIYRRHQRSSLATLEPPKEPGRMVVFVAAWREADVIGSMLATALSRFDHKDYRIYVGAYPNDRATIDAIAAIAEHDDRVRLVINSDDGPTTKADCLNTLWRALLSDEATSGTRAKAVILHDAEDVVHSGELRIFDALIGRFDLVQLPVLPLVDTRSRWISGHYCDEFAENHGKALVTREAIGAAMPSAGVGCAFCRQMLGLIADDKGGLPFDRDSLTEDYELGLRIAERGGRGIFVRIPVYPRGPLVAIRAYFPRTLDAAVQQKSRWMTGIALAGWDRLGWRGGIAEFWMRLHDRRALLAAVVLAAGYLALVLTVLHTALAVPIGHPLLAYSDTLKHALAITATMLIWRLAMRFGFVTHDYGWREGLRAIPRSITANIIAMMAARRAVGRYLSIRREEAIVWGKTDHHFPDVIPKE